MDETFADDRLQFFLRNRDDIKLWATIESEVIAATRDMLGGVQPLIEERLMALDPGVVVGRHDSGAWERIIARHDHWPAAVGMVLEWHRNVDPFGASPVKIGVFFWADPSELVAVRAKFVASVTDVGLEQLGFKVPLESVWPVGARVPGSTDWWMTPTAWVEGIIDRLAAAWPLVAPALDLVLTSEPGIRDG